MRIFLICSKRFYDRVAEIKIALEEVGHIITLPNSYDNPDSESTFRALGNEEHSKWKSGMLRLSTSQVEKNEAVLVINFEKDGMRNYIGGATFLEMYDAFRHGKKIYLYNDIPEGILADEIIGFNPIIIRGDLSLVR